MIFRPSGGLLYHIRAWREGRRWDPFRAEVRAWLESWEIPTERLILLGPSAGHTLPTPWLGRFDHVDAFDLDPLAPWLFRRAHPGVTIRFHRRDVFWRDQRLSLAPLDEILNEAPSGTPVLFVNVLGQLLLEGDAGESEWRDFLHALRRRLDGRAWASYHDLFTDHGHEVIDHLTSGDWTEGLERRMWEWPLTRRSRHRIEAVRSNR